MKPRSPIYVILIIVLFLITLLTWVFSEGFDFLKSSFYWGVMLLASLLLLIGDAINALIENSKYSKLSDEEKRNFLSLKKQSYYKRLYEDAFARKDEKADEEIIIDHDYDGILELDNALPRWWVGLFYFGVLNCILYITAYSFTDFAHPDAELEKFIIEQDREIAAYELTAPQATEENSEYDPGDIEKGQALFKETCATCHNANGGGGIGPNLTDDEWINVRSEDLYKNILSMVWHGSKNNPTMRAFGDTGELKGTKIKQIAAFVYDLNQNKPNALDGAVPQGNYIKDWAKDSKTEGINEVNAIDVLEKL